MRNEKAPLAELMPLIRETLAAGNRVRFSPRGESMLPMLVPGRDSVELVSPPDTLQKYQLPLYQRDDGQYVLHRIVRVGETYTCAGDNQFSYEAGVRRDQIIAVVDGFTRNGKNWRQTDTAYRLYCGFWHHTRLFRRYWRGGLRRLRALMGKGKRSGT